MNRKRTIQRNIIRKRLQNKYGNALSHFLRATQLSFSKGLRKLKSLLKAEGKTL